jgi:hypothetical protein
MREPLDKISPAERLRTIREEFQSLALGDEKLIPERAAMAFSLTRDVGAIKTRGNFHALEVINAFKQHRRPDPTIASLAKLEFDLYTTGVAKSGIGTLLVGLEGDELEKAKKFCSAVSAAYDGLSLL